VAHNRRWQNRNTNEWEEQTSFFNCVAWGDLGEHVGSCLRKGDRITVNGRLEQRSWEDGEGQKRQTVELICDDVAASLRWATVDITRIKGSGGGGGHQDAPPPVDPHSPFDNDEEPF
jgi:single-strand DNA-binding protein